MTFLPYYCFVTHWKSRKKAQNPSKSSFHYHQHFYEARSFTSIALSRKSSVSRGKNIPSAIILTAFFHFMVIQLSNCWTWKTTIADRVKWCEKRLLTQNYIFMLLTSYQKKSVRTENNIFERGITTYEKFINMIWQKKVIYFY